MKLSPTLIKLIKLNEKQKREGKSAIYKLAPLVLRAYDPQIKELLETGFSYRMIIDLLRADSLPEFISDGYLYSYLGKMKEKYGYQLRKENYKHVF